MRRLAAGFLAGTLALACVAAISPAPAAASTPAVKVVLIVGATHDVTPSYRASMNVVAATAAKYTRNVVKVYSPNATWSAVKAALKGASIVVYMGHGNGFPSPYASALRPTTEDGFGLNASAGHGDYNNVYYGESYVASSISLAPGAVVILSHLCYASGNAEPGNPQPSLSVAKQRIDNFAAGFMKAGAAAVIADGHNNPSYYIDALFTTHQTVANLWKADPWAAHHVFTFSSTRSPGRTAWADPDTYKSGTYTNFYRSLVTKPTITTDYVTGAPFAATDRDPATFLAPGAAEVTAPSGAPQFADASLAGDPVRTLPSGAHLRVVSYGGQAPDGSPVVRVTTLDGSNDGFVAGSGLTPRDSTGPRIWMEDAGAGALSPNGDGSGDTVALSAVASEVVTWHVRMSDVGGDPVADLAAPDGAELHATWDGRHAGAAVPDGTYTATITAADDWGNPVATASLAIHVDTAPPTLSGGLGEATPTFSPNGDGRADTVSASFATTEPGTVDVVVRDEDGTAVRHDVIAAAAGPATVTWDGRTTAGSYVADGTYAIVVAALDRAGNRSATVSGHVTVYTALSKVAAALARFFPQDGDSLAATDRLTFALDTPATVTWRIVDAHGAAVATRYDAAALLAGSYAWTWNGRDSAGAMVPRGWYWSSVTVTDGTSATTERARVLVDAFAVSLSDSTPGRGQRITILVTSTERLARNPTVTVSQPGVVAHTATVTKTGTYTYRATYLLRTSGTAGTLLLRVRGNDVSGGFNSSTVTFPIH